MGHITLCQLHFEIAWKHVHGNFTKKYPIIPLYTPLWKLTLWVQKQRAARNKQNYWQYWSDSSYDFGFAEDRWWVLQSCTLAACACNVKQLLGSLDISVCETAGLYKTKGKFGDGMQLINLWVFIFLVLSFLYIRWLKNLEEAIAVGWGGGLLNNERFIWVMLFQAVWIQPGITSNAIRARI